MSENTQPAQSDAGSPAGPSDSIRDRLTALCVHHNPGLGRTGPDKYCLYSFFSEVDPADPKVESAMDGERCVGWEWPCGSVYGESKYDADPEVKGLKRTFEGVDVIASLVGAPHVLDHDAALALYRSSGWVHDARLTIDPDQEDLTDVALLYRPTIVLHDRTSPGTPIAVGTAELRIEVAGPKALITSARVLGFAVLHRKPAPAAWFLAHVLSMELGDESRYGGYARNDGQCFIMLGTPQTEVTDAKLSPAVSAVMLDHFHDHFRARAMCHDELELAQWGLEDPDEAGADEEPEGDAGERHGPDDRELALGHMSIEDAADQTECARLMAVLDPAAREALERFATADKRPGFAAFLGRGRREAANVDKLDIPQRLTAASDKLSIELAPVQPDGEFRSMSTQVIELRGIGAKPLQAHVLHYEPWRDRHPFDTWDNSEFGLLDTLELIHPGASMGEGFSLLDPPKLGYASRPILCVVLQTPDRWNPALARVTKANAKHVAAGMLIGAARAARAKVKFQGDSMACLELPILVNDGEDEPGERAGAESSRLLAREFEGFGFKQASEWLYACPATVWDRICATACGSEAPSNV